jgi:hypothetical protein
MKKFDNMNKVRAWLMTMLLGFLVVGCGGGRDTVLGSGTSAAGPTVTATVPLARTPIVTGVAINSAVTATFSKAMDATTISTSSFTVACPAGTPVTGTVAYVAASRTATFSHATNFPANTICTATISTGAKDSTGLPLAAPFVWQFRTAATPDTIPPTVTLTVPADLATGVATNTLVTATFSEDMNPTTISGTSFTLVNTTLGGTPVAGTVAYSVGARMATFTPTTPATLPASTLFTATVTTAVTDLAGNAMVANKVWTFTTGAAPDTTPPTVTLVNPLDLATGVCSNKTVNATFSEAMDATTITTLTYTLAPSASPGSPVAGLVTYDAVTKIASLNPTADLTASTSYTATVIGGASGVKDLAGNALAVNKVWTFTTGATACAAAPALGAAAPFGGFGGNATITNDGLNTVVNGDLGVNAAATTVTGFRDGGGTVYTITPNNNGLVTGLIYTANTLPGPGNAVIQARADALVAFNSLSPANLPGGIDVSSLAQCPSCGGAGQGPGQLAGRTLPPGVYLSTTGTYGIGITAPTAGNLTLDAQGDANAVFIFQTAAGTGTLTVGLTGPATPATPIQVLLINGAQAKNVFWYVPGGATIGTGATMVGTMLADASITMSTTGGSPPTAVTTTLNGRAIALTAGVTMTNTVINVPAP